MQGADGTTILGGPTRRQHRALIELIEGPHAGDGVRAAAWSWVEIPRRLQSIVPVVVTSDGRLHVYDDRSQAIAQLPLAEASTRDDGSTVPTSDGVVRIRGPIDEVIPEYGIDLRTRTGPAQQPLADLGPTSQTRFEHLAVVAWRPLRDATGAQDIRLDDRPSVHLHDWSVAVSRDTATERLPSFLQRAGEAGWELVSAVPAGSIEQNSASEAWLGALNLRDTRFERTLVQVLYFKRRLDES